MLLGACCSIRNIASRYGAAAFAPCCRSYHENIVNHYENPRNVGSIKEDDDSRTVVGTGLVGAPACGDVMKLQVAVEKPTGRIRDARFKTFGCGSAIASSSLATEWIKDSSLDEALRLKNADIARHLHLPPVKLHCSMLAEDAVASSVRDARNKIDGLCK